MVMMGGNYLKTTDANSGDKITFKDEGEWIESTRWKYDDGNPRVDFVIKVDFNGDEKSLRLNKGNREILTEAFGNDTKEWIGKTASITKEKVMVAGKKMDTIVLEVSAEETPF